MTVKKPLAGLSSLVYFSIFCPVVAFTIAGEIFFAELLGFFLIIKKLLSHWALTIASFIFCHCDFEQGTIESNFGHFDFLSPINYCIYSITPKRFYVNKLAGGTGFEPVHGGIKIRCLTKLGEPPTIFYTINYYKGQ
jgi:hypothetical protein